MGLLIKKLNGCKLVLNQLIGFAPNFAHSQHKRKYMKWWNKSEQTGFFLVVKLTIIN